jgi:hypothetical protein
MTESIGNRKCRPRIIRRCPEGRLIPAPFKPSGGGSGGGAVDDGGKYEAFDGTYGIAATKIAFISRLATPPAPDADYAVSLVAAGDGTDGKIELMGTQGVRITSSAGAFKGSAEETFGVEIVVDDDNLKNIRVQRGMLPDRQKIIMAPGQLVVDTGTSTVTVNSLEEIKLQVGPNSITLTPEGITITGVVVNIN